MATEEWGGLIGSFELSFVHGTEHGMTLTEHAYVQYL